METLDISRASRATIRINDYDQIPLTLEYNTTDTPAVPIDIRNYIFSFDLKAGNNTDTVKQYVLGPANASTFLSIAGADNNILNMQKMFEDIRDLITFNVQYRLIQCVTDAGGNKLVHVIYSIDDKRY